jgi:site-specific recombinase XerD
VLLIDSTDGDSPILIRDRAILELLYSTGLRRAEIAALDLTDIDLADRNRAGSPREGQQAATRADG